MELNPLLLLAVYLDVYTVRYEEPAVVSCLLANPLVLPKLRP